MDTFPALQRVPLPVAAAVVRHYLGVMAVARRSRLHRRAVVHVRGVYGPLQEHVRAWLLDYPSFFERKFEGDEGMRAYVRSQAAILIAQQLHGLGLYGATPDSPPHPKIARQRVVNLLRRLFEFEDRWRAPGRPRKAPRRPSAARLRAEFGPDAPVVEALWPAIRFLRKAVHARSLEELMATWREAGALHSAISPEYIGASLIEAARRTTRIARQRGGEDETTERDAVARVFDALQLRREAIFDTYKPTGDVGKVPLHLAVVAKNALRDKRRSESGPAPSTYRKFVRSGRVRAGDTEGAQKALAAARARQNHGHPDSIWEPLSLVARDLAGQFRCSVRTVYNIFHRERKAGRIAVEKGAVSFQIDAAAKKKLLTAMRQYSPTATG